MAVAGTGAALWGAQQGLNHVAGLPGAQRRFTGSGEVGSGQGLAFPVTMWMLDNPAPLDPAAYTLRISGAVARPQVWTLADLAAVKQAALEATLDCTGGWYTTQTWHGVPVASLLAAAQPVADALEVSFVSTTGYRWSVPLSEAQTLLLAQRVGDDLLDHGRGAPLRLVAPGRRGFQWVKWVTEIRVLTTRDLGQWGVIFTSGLEG
jgi:DMSO/TMAO reductase YedYZ molybdopterin-dependent catalytic subunit